jgi:hypothetical protein
VAGGKARAIVTSVDLKTSAEFDSHRALYRTNWPLASQEPAEDLLGQTCADTGSPARQGCARSHRWIGAKSHTYL